jgi:hypothetical protein
MTTGVPRKFMVLFSWRVNDVHTVERRLHARFAEYRISESREFFQVTPVRAISALLEEAGVIGGRLSGVRDDVDVLPSLRSIYGPLLDPDLTAVAIEVDALYSASLVCELTRDGNQIVLRRDMDLVAGEHGAVFNGTTRTDNAPPDATLAAGLLLDLDVYTLCSSTPLFSDRGARLISDLHERTELDDRAVREVLHQARTQSGSDDLDGVEAQIRRARQLSDQKLEIVSVHELAGRFLLSLRDASHDVEELRIVAGGDYDDRDFYSYAVVTQAVLDQDV